MRRALFGSLEHLAPPALLRLVSATSPSGVLEIETVEGLLRLEVERGRVAMPTKSDLEKAGKILDSRRGEFRFTPGGIQPVKGEVMSLTAFAEAAGAAASNLQMDLLLEDEFHDRSDLLPQAKIHVLPTQPLQNPLDELLSGLEAEAPGELLFAKVGVVTQDPRWWRGALEMDWRRRGWQIQQLGFSDPIDIEDLDLLVVHHQQGSARVGSEEDWLGLIRRASELQPPLPVVWVAPLGDPAWTHQLIEAGVSFLMPAPQGEAGEATIRFVESLSRVVDRQIQAQQREGHDPLPTGVSELVGALLSESDPDQGISSLLQLAAEHFTRGAVLMAEVTAIRCRAGFGYSLEGSTAVLPRGIGLIERVIRSGEAFTTIEPGASGSNRLAAVLGVSELPSATALIPLGRCGAVVGVLVADREGEELPDVADLVLLVGRLGGVVGS
ncbi:MAG: DUF4388 domain-containing protein [Acidobacteria bacterium]|uniref:DUF4388 domain-containing protein n=1 Tax=Candidatus Sulfomarinibacter kjeldsenii TaxID=2885994 RepID=A0A8J6YBF8_9BACT|nr:DUF4388 domain-containing protein [Candidatus Sulfomarinibacter kjeldsenii]MBD3855969.1 DUF4388 domain-containing protein [Candidatus Sulfomarinibacter kjeldsenii]MBD3870421.1 DUF4388 domain-containing protein [Candidatus Sulfomarinibacter kjeldsenii]